MRHIETNLPDDILFSVLSILPVKSLLRFMCVCKSWNSLIKSSAFIAAHDRHHYVNRNENDKNSYLLHMPKNVHKPRQVCTLLREIDEPPSYVKHCNLVLPLSGYNVVGACEGLICLMTKKSRYAKHIYIWNPLVGTLKYVPPSETEPPLEWNRVVLGFGFAKDDYKIVKITFNVYYSCVHKLEMYSLATNSWRIIECEPTKLLVDDWSKGVSFEGSIYWLLWKGSESILRFNLDKEIFEEMAAPPYGLFEKLELVVANGFLVLLDLKSYFVKTWVKKESSWIDTEKFIFTEDTSHPRMELCKSGNIVYVPKYRASPWAAIQDEKVFAYDYDKINGWKLREMEISWTQMSELVRVRETLFLLDEQPKNGYNFSEV